jgi:hypothetical protein
MKQDRPAKAIDIRVSSERTVVAAAVREGVTLALKEDESDLAIAIALREASLGHIPEHGAALCEFVTGPLRNALQIFGHADDATLVVARILHILTPQIALEYGYQTSVSGIRSIVESAPRTKQIEIISSEPSPFFDDQPTSQIPVDLRDLDCTLTENRETKRAPAARSASVLMWTDDTQISLHLSLILGANVALKTFYDIPLFIEALDSNKLTETVVILDLRSAQLASTAWTTLTAHLPHNASVVLWGDIVSIETRVRDLGYVLPSEWVTCSSAAQTEDISALIRCAIAPFSRGTDTEK